MSDVPAREEARTLSPRAAVALLTLQLRAAQKEADALEAEAAELDVEHDPALVELRGRIAPLIEEKRRALAAELDRARGEAAAAAPVIAAPAPEPAVSAWSAPVELVDEPEPVVPSWLPPVQVDDEPETVDLAELVTSPQPVVDWSAPMVDVIDIDEVADTVEEPPAEIVIDAVPVAAAWPTPQPIDDAPQVVDADETWAAWRRPGESPSESSAALVPVTPQQPPATVMIDTESFAKALALAIATVVEQMPERQAPRYVERPQRSAPPKKSSLWSHAWHLDVILLLVALFIVAAVLAAWMA